jgi:hypothetical protein
MQVHAIVEKGPWEQHRRIMAQKVKQARCRERSRESPGKASDPVVKRGGWERWQVERLLNVCMGGDRYYGSIEIILK